MVMYPRPQVAYKIEGVQALYQDIHIYLSIFRFYNFCDSERLVVALAMSLPALSHLTLSCISRSAIHVDPCDVPYDVPIVTNNFDVLLHPILGT
jgi:hypothetical protein